MAGTFHDDLEVVQEALHRPVHSHAVDIGGQHDGELVAPQPRRKAPGIAGGAQPIGDPAQHRVARGMAEGVVDALEAVEVDQQDGHVAVRGACVPQPGIENPVKLDAVGQLGQVVGAGQMTQTLLQA